MYISMGAWHLRIGAWDLIMGSKNIFLELQSLSHDRRCGGSSSHASPVVPSLIDPAFYQNILICTLVCLVLNFRFSHRHDVA